MISAASAQIEAVGGQHLKTTIIKNGEPTVVPNYATVQGILLGAIASFVIFITIIGPEFVSLLFPHRDCGSLNFAFPGAETMDLTLRNRIPRSRRAAQRRASHMMKRSIQD
jgi:hypothetical protein